MVPRTAAALWIGRSRGLYSWEEDPDESDVLVGAALEAIALWLRGCP